MILFNYRIILMINSLLKLHHTNILQRGDMINYVRRDTQGTYKYLYLAIC